MCFLEEFSPRQKRTFQSCRSCPEPGASREQPKKAKTRTVLELLTASAGLHDLIQVHSQETVVTFTTELDSVDTLRLGGG